MTRAFRQFVDAVLPTSCISCSALGSHICQGCASDFVFSNHPVIRGDFQGCSATMLDQSAHLLISAVKDHGRTGLLGEIADSMASAVLASAASGKVFDRLIADKVSARHFCVMPIPSGRAALARRGFDPVSSLAKLVARRLGVTLHRGLRLVRETKDQRSLDVRERAANLGGAMRFTSSTESCGNVLLLDDVVTTGATLLEGKRALEEAGIRALGFVTFAETRSHRDA